MNICIYIYVKRVAYNHVMAIYTAMTKRPKMCPSSSITIVDTDIVNALQEPLRPVYVPFGGYKAETKDLGGIFCCKINFWL